MNKEKLTLIFNNPTPSMGGIPRYAYNIKTEIESETIDMTEVYGENIAQKLYNVLWGRKKHIKKNEDKLEGINHFIQPEIYYKHGKESTDIITIHDLTIYQSWADIHNIYETGRKFLLAKRFSHSLKHGDHFIAVSSQTKEEILDEGIPEEKVTVINSGIRDKFEIQNFDREKRVGYLGNLNQRKRVGKLLKDWSDSYYHDFDGTGVRTGSDYDLYIGGWGGSEAEKLEEEYGGRVDVHFKHRIPEDNIVDYYNSLQAFFFPSSYEGQGLPILEANACGTPVFIYKDARIPEEVKKFAYEVKSVSEVPDILSTISKEERKRKSRQVKEEFDWNKTIEKTKRVYKGIGYE